MHNKYKLSILQKILFRLKKNKPINTFRLNGKSIAYNFAPYWFKHSYQEIFEQKVYQFTTKEHLPYKIVDCGSNIGLSIIYYKLNYPNSTVIGFEADPVTFQILQQNISEFQFKDVSLYQKAVWVHENGIMFKPNGMGGSIRLTSGEDSSSNILCKTIRLRQFLETHIDFLKIDIEGAEIEVLQDCADLLNNVDNIFIEYHCYKGQQLQLDILLETLKASNFRYYIRQAYENMKLPFVEKTGIYMDMQLNIFCFR